MVSLAEEINAFDQCLNTRLSNFLADATELMPADRTRPLPLHCGRAVGNPGVTELTEDLCTVPAKTRS